jgi:hypothetical protein
MQKSTAKYYGNTNSSFEKDEQTPTSHSEDPGFKYRPKKSLPDSSLDSVGPF